MHTIIVKLICNCEVRESTIIAERQKNIPIAMRNNSIANTAPTTSRGIASLKAIGFMKKFIVTPTMTR